MPRVKPGDRVIIDGGMSGTVVANLDKSTFSSGYTAADWTYLGSGILVETEEAGLVHLLDATDVVQSHEAIDSRKGDPDLRPAAPECASSCPATA